MNALENGVERLRDMTGRPGPLFKRLVKLSGPVVASELGWMTMGLVDTLMVGRLSPEALGGVAIGGNLFIAVAIFGFGMLLGLDYLVAHAHGGGRPEEAHSSFHQGVYVSLGLSVILGGLIFLGMPLIGRFGIDPAVVREAVPYLTALTWGLPPLLLFFATRRYLQAMGTVKPIMVALISANLINLAADWVFIFGRFGLPAMGTAGAGWATCVSRLYMLLFLLTYIARRERRNPTGFRFRPEVHRERLQRLVLLGFPAAVQISLEVGVFATATMLAGRLGATPLAAHQIVLVIASFTFMVPLGISSAGAVLVGQAMGRGDVLEVRGSGWMALGTGVSFMVFSALTLATFPEIILRFFTADPGVVSTGVALLRVAALFQIFDGAQVVATGILRGTGETRTPMLANLVGHWFLGLPAGVLLAFALHGGIVGLWGGLCVGLMSCAVFLLVSWTRRVRSLSPAGVPATAPATALDTT